MSRLIVFDCDGTLVDSQQLIVEAARQTLLAHELEPVEANAVRAVIGLSLSWRSRSWCRTPMSAC